MMGRSLARERDVAMRAVREAALVCRAVQGGLDLSAMAKEDRSPVTIADFGSQALICRALEEAFPDDPVVAEEDAADLRRAENAGSLSEVVRHVAAVRGDA